MGLNCPSAKHHWNGIVPIVAEVYMLSGISLIPLLFVTNACYTNIIFFYKKEKISKQFVPAFKVGPSLACQRNVILKGVSMRPAFISIWFLSPYNLKKKTLAEFWTHLINQNVLDLRMFFFVFRKNLYKHINAGSRSQCLSCLWRNNPATWVLSLPEDFIQHHRTWCHSPRTWRHSPRTCSKSHC